MKRIALLGSTGSIGLSTLDVAESLGDRIEVAGLTANRNIQALLKQIARYRPRAVSVGDRSARDEVIRIANDPNLEVFWGQSGLDRIAGLEGVDLVVNAVVGAAGILPTLVAIRAGKDVAIANKESLVAAGGIIVRDAKKSGRSLIPVDSEHSAIHQCLRGEDMASVRRIILTASGGPLVDMGPDEISAVRASEALKHPTWSMGRKVTIDSATLLNKGFEVIEAHWLFGIHADNIDVVIERKSIVHSLVEFVDGSVIAVLSNPDMRLPIQYAWTYPDRVETSLETLDLGMMGSICFDKPDYDRFPCLRLAFEAARKGGTVPAVLSAADEIAVASFLEGKIAFGDIHSILSEVIGSHRPSKAGSLEAVLEADRWARQEAEGIVGQMSGGC
jgi:1-deoxy-D-xylulose-5-phosphate reductoisomerase